MLASRSSAPLGAGFSAALLGQGRRLFCRRASLPTIYVSSGTRGDCLEFPEKVANG